MATENRRLFARNIRGRIVAVILIKLSKTDGEALRVASQSLAVNAETENTAKKARDAAKKIIERELLAQRKIAVDQLSEKEIVLVQVDGVDVLKIERKGANRLDGTALAAAHPEIVTEFTKPSVASYFSSLIKS